MGGPSSSPTNYLNKASRFQRTLLYNRENESALLNTLGQGPAAYETHLIERIRFGEANKFTIPRVSSQIFQFTYHFLIDLGKKKDYLEERGQKDSNIIHLRRNSQQIDDEEGQQGYHWTVQTKIRRDKDEPNQRNDMEEGIDVSTINKVLIYFVLNRAFKFINNFCKFLKLLNFKNKLQILNKLIIVKDLFAFLNFEIKLTIIFNHNLINK